ncbi:hypothetical protein C8A01DRAFT_31814 [Parachaetomium inaequale]|uniref:Uncharacterized protein n=1 Tax=Parachaetomium inaequale TaxID=2588326 RepID=A0AAN6PSS0_9PEZI|nr:hypothetical protein C8A01DRAFT_31814 [Parachaetomium inaequale]
MAAAIGAWILILSLAASWHWPGAEAACYYPSGRVSPNDTPCRDDTTHATCCGQGYACLTNGICQATGEELAKPGATEFVSSCPLFCIEEDVDFLDGGSGIAKCGNTTDDLYICLNSRSAQDASCEERRKVLYFPGTPSAITTVGVTPRTTASSTSTTTTAPSSSPTSETASSTSQGRSTSTSSGRGESTGTSETPVPADDTSSSNLGAIIGGAVGGTVAVALAVLGGWLLARKRGGTTTTTTVDGNDSGAVPALQGAPDQPPGEPKYGYGFGGTQAYDDGAYGAPGVANRPVQNGPYELLGPPETLQHRSPMEMSVELPLELPGGHR